MALPQAIARTPVFRFADLAASSARPGRAACCWRRFEVFSNAMLAERWFPDLAGWAAAAAAIDLGLRPGPEARRRLSRVVRRDQPAFYERLERAKRSGGFVANPSRRRRGFRIPYLPWMGGVGPNAWRQLLLTVRKSSAIVSMVLTFTILILIWNWYSSGGSGRPTVTPAAVVGLVSYITYIVCLGFPVAFRGDLDHLDFLKTLPFRPLVLTIGELAGCVAVLAAIQLAILAICGAAAASGWWLLLVAAVLAPAVQLALAGDQQSPVPALSHADDIGCVGRPERGRQRMPGPPAPDAHPSSPARNPRGPRGPGLSGQRLLGAGDDRHRPRHPPGRSRADDDARGPGVRPVRSQHRDAGLIE